MMEYKGQYSPTVQLMSITPEGESLIEAAGHVCYATEGAGQDRIQKWIKSGHESMLEHASATFEIYCSRVVTHELVRHRIAAYCLSGDAVVPSFVPSGSRGTAKKHTMQQLYDWTLDPKRKSRVKLMRIRCVDEDGRIVPGQIASVTASGEKIVFAVKTATGRTIKASKDHLFLALGGWKRLEDLRVGERVAMNGKIALASREWIEQKYLTEGMQREEVAALAGVCDALMGKWIQAYGLQKHHSQYPNRHGPSVGSMPPMSAGQKVAISRRMSGTNNHRWKEFGLGRTGGYLRTQRAFALTECAICGITERLERHHVDHEPTNTALDNVMILCQSCHRSMHAKSRVSVRVAVFEPIISIEEVGVEQTYDLEMAGDYHNFVANGFVVHNSQRSQRYVDESTPWFVIPDEIKADDRAEWIADTHAAYNIYAKWLQRGYQKQIARYHLPNSCMTIIVATWNYREIRHILKLRTSKRAQPEMQVVAKAILAIMLREAPQTFADFALSGGEQ